ncbi:hypothetical protein [uncultured Chryseobacterium sp.]|uniref:hypothetical protein n=1 Tax=uncultured Chryseobacterium sp. TaxID=259322 RepID=UPI0025EB2EBD|nr:hypothetical protein [uncultured Chryseobacterium sp.]
MNVKEILNKVENFSSDRKYWFIRTDYGKHFEVFYKGEYIAIGWDYLALDELKTKSESEIKEKIAKNESLDVFIALQKGKITSIYNKIETFLSLKKGDIIVVPSRNSDRLAFGEIVDEEPYEAEDALEMGDYFKRRKVKWIDLKSIYDLDPIFFQLKANRHSISRIDRYSPYIDKIIGNLFKKGDNTHYVLNFETHDDINFRDLNALMADIDKLVIKINNQFNFNEDLNDFFVKINLQSPGTIELIKTNAGKSLAVLAFCLSVISCGGDIKNETSDKNLKDFSIENHNLLKNTQDKLDSLKVNTKDLTQPFKDGK